MQDSGQARIGWLAALSLMGCTAIIAPEELVTRCEIGPGGDPCAERGLVCAAGRCQTPTQAGISGACATGSIELCNGRDDDCDGLTDERQDTDGDGFTWCGGGDRALADCDDSDPAVHPADPSRGIAAAEELCDERDNDCDGGVDETSVDRPVCALGAECIHGECIASLDCSHGERCPAGQRCAVERHPSVCVPGDCRVQGCLPDEFCDAASRSCIALGDLGDPCTDDVSCRTGRCFPAAAVGLDTVASAVCSTACRTDADCGAGAICWTTGTGAKGCVAAAVVGRVSGTNAAGAACSTDADCRSGVCATGRCIGSCSRGSDCTGTATCGVFGPYDRGSTLDLQQLACTQPAGLAEAWKSCDTGTDCRSGICTSVFGASFCSAPCATTLDCAGLPLLGGYCGYLALPVPGSYREDRVQVCLPKLHDGWGETGTACTDGSECVDRACIGGQCAPSCGRDSDCPSDRRCEPTAGAGGWEMHCIR